MKRFWHNLNLPALTGFVSLLALASLAMAGSLTPGAAPAPTMHTLGEIFDSIASTTYDSSSIPADANGSLLAVLKSIETNSVWASASPDIYNLNSGNVGIGTSTPGASLSFARVLDVVGESAAIRALGTDGPAYFIAESYEFAPPSPHFEGRFANGSYAAPEAVVGDETLLRLVGRGFDGVGFDNINAEIAFRAAENFSPSAQGTDMRFRTTPLGSTAAQTRLTISSEGNVGIGTTAPTTTLDVVGSASLSGNFELSGFVSSNLTPTVTDTYDLGTTALRWRDLYLASGSLHIGTSGDEAVIDYNVNDDYLSFKPDGATSVFRITDGGDASTSGTFEITRNGTTANLLKLTDSSVTSTIGISNNDGDFQIRLPSVSFATEYAALSISSQSGGSNIGAPTRPQFKGKISGSGSPNFLDLTQDIFVAGTYAYAVSYLDSRLVVIDISNPASPTFEGSIATGIQPLRVIVVGRYAYVISSSTLQLLDVYDVSVPSSPRLVGRLTLSSSVQGFDISGRYAYVAASGTLLVVDLADPSRPRLAGSAVLTGPGGGDVFIQGRFAYMARGTSNRFDIMDISNPTKPVRVGTLSGSGSPNYLGASYNPFVQGKYAYVTGSEGLNVIDVSNPLSPITVAHLAATAANGLIAPQGLEVAGRYAYIADFSSGVTVIDISRPTSPVFVGKISGSGSPNFLNGPVNLAISGRYAFVAVNNDDAVTVVDLGGLESPVILAGDIGAARAEISGNTVIGGNLHVGRAVVIGEGGLLVNGPLGLSIASLSDNTASISAESIIRASHRTGRLSGDFLDISAASSTTADRFTGNFAKFKLAGTPRFIIESSGAVLASGAAQFGAAGAPSSVSYSRFGTATTTHAGSITLGNDLLISGDLEINGSVAFDGTIGSNITPTLTDTYDLGTSALRWRDLYLASGSLHIGTSGDEAVIDYSVNDDYLSFKPDGSTTRMAILDAGNVGFGTTTPDQRIDIAGNILASTSGNVDLILNSTGNQDGLWRIRSTSTDGLQFLGSASSTFMTLASSGMLGIGTTTATYQYDTKLQVTMDTSNGGSTAGDGIVFRGSVHDGGAYGNRTILRIEDTLPAGAIAGGFLIRALGDYNGDTDASDLNTVFSVRGDGRSFFIGNVGIGTTNAQALLQIKASNSIAFDPFDVSSSSGTSNFRISKGGNVGINNTSPTTMLDVTGNASVSGGLEITDQTDDALAALKVNGYSGNSGTNVDILFSANVHDGGTYGIRTLLRLEDTNPAGAVGGGYLIRALGDYTNDSDGSDLNELFALRGDGRTFFIGNVGIGTTNAQTLLQVKASNSIAFDPFDVSSSSGTSNFRISKGGNVGINDSTPTTTLDVSGNASISGAFELSGLAASDADDVYICRDPTSNRLTTGATCTASSIRFKKNVQNLEHGLDWVSQLRPVTFDWKHNGSPSLGFIAEEVNEISPLLAIRQDGEIFSVNYQIMTSVLAKAIQELNLTVTELAAMQTGAVPETGGSFLQNLFDGIVGLFRDALGIVFEHGSIGVDRVKTKSIELEGDDGELYCVRIIGGQVTSTAGECDAAEGISSGGGDPVTSPSETPPADVEGDPTPTPEISAEPTPEPAPESSAAPEPTPESPAEPEPAPEAPDEAPPAPEIAP